jgi:alcohol dehydrogenase (cytochrome c)
MKQTSADRANHLTSGRRAPSGWPTAFDAAIGKQRWQYQSDKPMIGGVVVTGGDLVFAAEITGDFLALDAKDREVLFRYPLDGPAAGGLVSYGSSDRQYVAVFRGSLAVTTTKWPRRLAAEIPTITVFGLKP